ncbi:hypothetical protein [Myxococcus sp. NMCA1]|uniref:hypothetical protein n=1 Tax=Myxococcus sp. NMCA1 TaxID=2996785 RepID=UPI0022855FEC|nr:hypothetical protein [Myxococcus sp. NMCA1]WAM28268.1 hypothetical protein OZ403_09160 [Myxococcus sp. NMCA1]
MATKWQCATSTCAGRDLTDLVEAARGRQSTIIQEVGLPEGFTPSSVTALPSVLDIEVVCPRCKTHQMFDLRRTDAKVQGRPILDGEASELAKLRTLFEPQKSAERLEAFGTWLFNGTALFTTLVGFYAYTVHDKVKAASQVFFTLALVLLGVSMAFAARMKTPARKTFNPDSPSSMLKALDERATERGDQLKWASVFFATALAFTGAAPALGALFTSRPESGVTTQYTRDASGKLLAVFKATAMKPGDVFGARVRKVGSPEAVLLEGAQSVKADGTGELTLEVPKLDAAGGPWELATYIQRRDKDTTAVSTGVHLLSDVALSRPERSLGAAFSFSPKGTLVLEAQGTGLSSQEPVELKVKQASRVLGWTRGLASLEGTVVLKLEIDALDTSKDPVVLTMHGVGRDGQLEQLFEKHLPGPVQQATGR